MNRFFRPKALPPRQAPEFTVGKGKFPVTIIISQGADGWWSFRAVLTHQGRDYLHNGTAYITKSRAYEAAKYWGSSKANEIRRAQNPVSPQTFRVEV